jgi:hypothetical protein
MPVSACKVLIGFARVTVVAATLGCLTMAATTAMAKTINGVSPATPQPDSKSLAPGIAVEYAVRYVRWVDELKTTSGWKKGKPLAQIDYNTGNGTVLTSDRTEGVCARLTGFIKLDKTGDYQFAIQSNDGVRMKLDGKVIISDPGVHYDQFSPNVTVPISTPGWYALDMEYFQRRGTATLELYWQPPGMDSFEFVPASAFSHSKP